MSLSEYIYEGLPTSAILGLYDEAAATVAERMGTSVQSLLPVIAPFTILQPVDPNFTEFGSKLSEEISMELRLFLGKYPDGSSHKSCVISLKHSIPMPLSFLLEVGPQPDTTLGIFLAANEDAMNKLADIDGELEVSTTLSDVEDALADADGNTIELCEMHPTLARQMAWLMGKYVLGESTGIVESREITYTVHTHPQIPLIKKDTLHKYESGDLGLLLESSLHYNGILVDSVQTGVDGTKSLLDQVGETDDFMAELELMFEDGFGGGIVNEVALEQTMQDIDAIRALIKTWQRPSLLIPDHS